MIQPDRVFFLDLSMYEIGRRGGFGDERYEKADLQIRVRECFNQWIENDPVWQLIDAAKSPEALFSELSELAVKVVNSINGSNICDTLFQ